MPKVTLIVHGNQDILVLSNGEFLALKIPNAELVYFDSNAHMIHTEETDKFNETLIKFQN